METEEKELSYNEARLQIIKAVDNTVIKVGSGLEAGKKFPPDYISMLRDLLSIKKMLRR